jgi:hypothetical protein
MNIDQVVTSASSRRITKFGTVVNVCCFMILLITQVVAAPPASAHDASPTNESAPSKQAPSHAPSQVESGQLSAIPNAKSEAYRIVLPDGAVIELVGLREYPEPHGWWRPDGSPLKTIPSGETPTNVRDYPRWDPSFRELAIQATLAPGADITVSYGFIRRRQFYLEVQFRRRRDRDDSAHRAVSRRFASDGLRKIRPAALDDALRFSQSSV